MADLGRASAILAAGTTASRLLGFVKIVLLTYAIGQFSAGATSFAVANQLPNNVYVIVAGGVLNAVLVPQIVKSALHADGGRGYINKLVTLGIVILGVTTIAATLLAPLLVRISASQFGPERTGLAVAFAFWCLPQIFFYGLYTVLGEILNARNSFGPFTLAPLVNNVVAIAGIAAFLVIHGSDEHGRLGAGQWDPGMIVLIGGTATLGVAAQALILFAFWRRVGLSYRPDFQWRGVGLGTAGRLAGWTFGMLVITQLAGLVQTNVMSSVGTKDVSIAVLQNSWLVFMLPHSIVTVSIATAYFTRMSEHSAARRMGEFVQDLSGSIRTIGLLIVLAATAIIATAIPFARLFTPTAGEATVMGLVIIAYAIGLLPFSLVFLLQRAFYALDDTRTPFFFTAGYAVLFSALALLFGLTLPSPILGIAIAFATTTATTAQAFVALLLLRRRLGTLDLAHMLASGVRFAIAAVPALVVGGIAVLVLVVVGGFALSSRGAAIVTVVVVGALVALVYLGVLRMLHAPELDDALGPFLRRIRRRRSTLDDALPEPPAGTEPPPGGGSRGAE